MCVLQSRKLAKKNPSRSQMPVAEWGHWRNSVQHLSDRAGTEAQDSYCKSIPFPSHCISQLLQRILEHLRFDAFHLMVYDISKVIYNFIIYFHLKQLWTKMSLKIYFSLSIF